jgi:hypothetical protein
MPKSASLQIAVVGIDIGKNTFHVVAHDNSGAIVLRQKWSRGQVVSRLANMPACRIGRREPVALRARCAWGISRTTARTSRHGCARCERTAPPCPGVY